MGLLIAGLALFIATHLVPAATTFRAGLIGRLGDGGYKGLFSLVSLAGVVLIVMGYNAARDAGPPLIWDPPVAMRHITLLLMLPVFVFFVSTYFPGRIKSALKHPMLVSVKLWALAHLLANGDLASMLLFSSLLAWAVVDRISLKRRTREASEPTMPGPAMRNDGIAVVVGLGAYAAIAFWLHPILFGVPVIG
ncbi:MAG: NnrU family protein [Pseudomonadota bacterium]